MSQMPPPPPGQPAPMGAAPAAGGNKNLYTILAWALFPPIGMGSESAAQVIRMFLAVKY